MMGIDENIAASQLGLFLHRFRVVGPERRWNVTVLVAQDKKLDFSLSN